MSKMSVMEFAGKVAVSQNGGALGNLARHLRDSTGEMVIRLAEFSDEMPPDLIDSFRMLLKEALQAPGAPLFETNSRTLELLLRFAGSDVELRGLVESRITVPVT